MIPHTCMNVSTMIAWVRGLTSEVFSTTVLPQMMGTATARKVNTMGAFHGTMLNLSRP